MTYLHPLLERSLAKTLGVPLFQEQLMQMAIDVAGFTPAESDRLRQAMGSKRSVEKMEQLRARLYAGMAERGITGSVADEIYEKLVAFANFGFPESHSVSFAYLVYSSAWLKYHYPAAFCAGLLDGQPMGFWSPQTIVADARRHGVVVRRPDINLSAAKSTLEACPSSAGGAAVRMGISYVRGVGDALAERIAAGRPYRRHGGPGAPERGVGGPGRGAGDGGGVRVLRVVPAGGVVERGGRGRGRRGERGACKEGPGLRSGARSGLRSCARSGLRSCARRDPVVSPVRTRPGCRDVGPARRDVGPARRDPEEPTVKARQGRLSGLVTGADAPPLAEHGSTLRSTRPICGPPGCHPTATRPQFVRADLAAMGVVTAAGLMDVPAGDRITVAGIVTHRQRPATAQGVTFMNLEDETGLINVICSAGAWKRYRRVARASAGADHRRAPGTGGNGHQRGGGTHPSPAPAPRRRAALPGLPLTARSYR